MLSRLHYCNAVLAGLSAATLQCRRCRVVNAAARLVFDLNRRDIDNVTSALRELHIIDYPLNNESSTSCACSFTDHISDLHTPVADMPSRSSWRTSSNGNLLLSRTERRFPLDIFLSTSFFSLSLSLRYCHLLLLLTLFLRAPVSGGCILPWCPVQCVLHFWTNKLID